jgi:hypothetical protein
MMSDSVEVASPPPKESTEPPVATVSVVKKRKKRCGPLESSYEERRYSGISSTANYYQLNIVKDIEEVKRHKLLLPSEHDVLVVLHGTGKLVVSMTVMYVTAAKATKANGESDIP